MRLTLSVRGTDGCTQMLWYVSTVVEKPEISLRSELTSRVRVPEKFVGRNHVCLLLALAGIRR